MLGFNENFKFFRDEDNFLEFSDLLAFIFSLRFNNLIRNDFALVVSFSNLKIHTSPELSDAEKRLRSFRFYDRCHCHLLYSSVKHTQTDKFQGGKKSN